MFYGEILNHNLNAMSASIYLWCCQRNLFKHFIFCFDCHDNKKFVFFSLSQTLNCKLNKFVKYLIFESCICVFIFRFDAVVVVLKIKSLMKNIIYQCSIILIYSFWDICVLVTDCFICFVEEKNKRFSRDEFCKFLDRK